MQGNRSLTVGALLLSVGLKERLTVTRQRVLVHGENTWNQTATNETATLKEDGSVST